jgi:hypothetical protein
VSEQKRGPVPSTQFADEQIVNWLIDECRDVSSRTAAVTTSGDRILAAGSTVIALSATVAIGGGKSYLLMWLPLAVSIVIVYGLYLRHMAMLLMGYQVGLELEIERRTGLPLIAWQSRIYRDRRKGQASGLIILGATVYIVSVGIAITQALHTLSREAWGHERAWLYVSLTATSVLIGIGVIVYSYWAQHGSVGLSSRRTTDMFVAT